MKKAQISMEYLVIVGLVFVITVPLIIIFQTHSQNMNDDIISNQIDHIANKILDSAEAVYYLGEPSKTTLRVFFPNRINNITISGYEITFQVKRHNGLDDVVKLSSVPVNGTLPTTSGIHNIIIESRGSYTWIGT
ncbi:MAG: hypothetical protein ABIH76_07175 [Candidatus Bathyarchaeota archaeon]